MISQEAVNFISEKVYNEDPTTWMPESFTTSSPSVSPKNNYEIDIEHCCAPVIHPITGETITTYQKFIKDPHTKDIWSLVFGREFGHLARGMKSLALKEPIQFLSCPIRTLKPFPPTEY